MQQQHGPHTKVTKTESEALGVGYSADDTFSLAQAISAHPSFAIVLVTRCVQLSSVQFPDREGRREDMEDDTAEILFQLFFFFACFFFVFFFPQKGLVSSSGMDRDVRYLRMSI